MIAVRSWGLSEAEGRELLRELQFRHFKWDTSACGGCLVLAETLVISRETHEDVVRIVEALHGALGRFERRIRTDAAALTRLEIPPALHPLISAEVDCGPQCARYELFPTEDGRLMVSEFNEDVPGGFNEAQGIPDLLGDPGPGNC